MRSAPAGRREHRLALAALVAIVLFRSGVFVFWPQAHFDADSAITGLMAKHLAEGQAFPLFYYGQSYMLGVEAYLAAPLFLAAGPSVTALKLPLLAINLAVALLLFRSFRRDAHLRPLLALLAVLPFALSAPGTAARILEANGGNAGPFLYIVLLWVLRDRPVLSGLALGIGFLNREFTIYGALALLAIDLFRRRLFTTVRLRHWAAAIATAALVWGVLQYAKPFSSAAGPGTTLADVYQPHDNITELVSRVCLDWRATAAGLPKIPSVHWPVLFGTERLALIDFGVDSTLWQGMHWSWLLLVACAATGVVTVSGRIARDRAWRDEYDVCAYFVLVGALSVLGYLVGRCGEVGFYWTRYDLLSLLGASGLSAWFLVTVRSTHLRRLWIASLCVWLGMSAAVHARLWAEYLTAPPIGGKQAIIRELDARGIRFALADYWLAYAITFLTNERIVVASDTFVRIPVYKQIVGQHPGEAVRISRTPCAGGSEVIRRVYFCRAPD